MAEQQVEFKVGDRVRSLVCGTGRPDQFRVEIGDEGTVNGEYFHTGFSWVYVAIDGKPSGKHSVNWAFRPNQLELVNDEQYWSELELQ